MKLEGRPVEEDIQEMKGEIRSDFIVNTRNSQRLNKPKARNPNRTIISIEYLVGVRHCSMYI